jgi:capsular polysaccharide biosynthesis protein
VASIVSGYLAEYLDPSFRTPEEVSDTLKMPVLATMPKRAA